MERQAINKFYAISFDNRIIEFIVFNDNTMDCPTLGINSFNKIILKPRFELYGKNLYYTYDVKSEKNHTSSRGLIGNYIINKELFTYLKQRDMITYSSDMAYLYNFNDRGGYDKKDNTKNQNGVGHPFKWAQKKGKVLIKQRKGIFN